jgi:hypothetical protein
LGKLVEVKMLDSSEVQAGYYSFVRYMLDRKDNVSLEFRIFGYFMEPRYRME